MAKQNDGAVSTNPRLADTHWIGTFEQRRNMQIPGTPLEQYAVGSLKLVAVIYDTQNPKAMVEDEAGSGYTIGLGTRIGNRNGVVKMIDSDHVVVEEDFIDSYGETKRTDVVLRLRPEAGND
jgi:Tfp pilus assembly protein PilP